MDFFVKLIQGSWTTLQEMTPYLLLGFLIAGVISVCLPVGWVRRHLNGRWDIPKAALFGIPLPLCSCGVIPVAASLRRAGSSPGATTAFLLSTPQTGVDSIVVMAGMLGAGFATFSPIAAGLSGMMAGWIVQRWGAPFPDWEQVPQEADSSSAKPSRPLITRILRHGFVVLCRDISKPLLVGILLAGLLGAAIPDGFFEGRMGNGWTGKIVLLAAGIPLYVCAAASVPIAASLILAGVSPGGALVFLMSGPATNAATVTVLVKIIGRKGTLLYFLAVACMALLCGTLLDLLLKTDIWPTVDPHSHSEHPLWKSIVAVGFIIWLVYLKWPRKKS